MQTASTSWNNTSTISSSIPHFKLIPIAPNNYTSLRIYLPQDGTSTDNFQLDIIEDLYKLKFYGFLHHNFIATGADPLIISVLDEHGKVEDSHYHKALITNKKGYQTVEISFPPEDLSLPVPDRIKKNFKHPLNQLGSSNAIAAAGTTGGGAGGGGGGIDEFYHVANESFKEDILKIEEKHCQRKSAMKIGVIFCRKGQTSPMEMLKNMIGEDRTSQSFLEFINTLGQGIDLNGWEHYMGDMKPGQTGAYYDKWNDIEVIYHVAPILTPEGQRRLIGNDIAVLFFLEEGEDVIFNPIDVSYLGGIPQIFAVVQPVKLQYRVGFFTNTNIKPFGPNIPTQLLSKEEMKNIVLTKTYNGLIMCYACPPINRLYYVPKKDTIDLIVAKYPSEKRKKTKSLQKDC